MEYLEVSRLTRVLHVLQTPLLTVTIGLVENLGDAQQARVLQVLRTRLTTGELIKLEYLEYARSGVLQVLRTRLDSNTRGTSGCSILFRDRGGGSNGLY